MAPKHSVYFFVFKYIEIRKMLKDFPKNIKRGDFVISKKLLFSTSKVFFATKIEKRSIIQIEIVIR